jgi:hypothetical protein
MQSLKADTSKPSGDEQSERGLEAAGSSLDRAVKTTVYLADGPTSPT